MLILCNFYTAKLGDVFLLCNVFSLQVWEKSLFITLFNGSYYIEAFALFEPYAGASH